MDGPNAIECRLGIHGINPIESGELWILRDPFLRKFYTPFDHAHRQVGFTLAKNSLESTLVCRYRHFPTPPAALCLLVNAHAPDLLATPHQNDAAQKRRATTWWLRHQEYACGWAPQAPVHRDTNCDEHR